MPLFVRENANDYSMFSRCLRCASHACLKVPTFAPKYLRIVDSSPGTNSSGADFELHPHCDFQSYTHISEFAVGSCRSWIFTFYFIVGSCNFWILIFDCGTCLIITSFQHVCQPKVTVDKYFALAFTRR